MTGSMAAVAADGSPSPSGGGSLPLWGCVYLAGTLVRDTTVIGSVKIATITAAIWRRMPVNPGRQSTAGLYPEVFPASGTGAFEFVNTNGGTGSGGALAALFPANGNGTGEQFVIHIVASATNPGTDLSPWEGWRFSKSSSLPRRLLRRLFG